MLPRALCGEVLQALVSPLKLRQLVPLGRCHATTVLFLPRVLVHLPEPQQSRLMFRDRHQIRISRRHALFSCRMVGELGAEERHIDLIVPHSTPFGHTRLLSGFLWHDCDRLS